MNDLAGAQRLSGDYASAERHFREAMAIAKNFGNREAIATYTGNLASLLLDRKQWAEAEKVAREGLGHSEGIDRQELIAADCARLARALARQGHKHEGLSHAHRAAEIYTRLRSHNLARMQDILKECEG
ncbi:MAG: tetratricopeptide repeat protein [Beggiatoa sp.]|nr:tetratricopeptide repeat protein [Beggiatoa sp.]